MRSRRARHPPGSATAYTKRANPCHSDVVVTACPSHKGATPLRRTSFASGYPYEDNYGYSRAVRVGDHVFVSGTTARGAALNGNTYTQAQAIIEIVTEALAQAGAEPRHVVRTVVYVIDMADAPMVARAHAERFGAIRPASTLVQVAGLTPSAARGDFEVTAIIAE